MGYFSNATEGEIYREKYCENCANEDEKTGCYIWWLHLSYNGDPEYKQILDALIPRKGTENGKCKMFRRRRRRRKPAPMPLFA